MRKPTVKPPQRVSDDVAFGEELTRYNEERRKVAVVVMGGTPIPLGLASTASCAADVDVARRLLSNYAVRQRVRPENVVGLAVQLQAHCAALSRK